MKKLNLLYSCLLVFSFPVHAENLLDVYQQALDSDKSVADYQQARIVLMYNLVERYFTVLAERDNLALSEQKSATTETHLKQVRRQYRNDLVKMTDVREIEAKLDSLLADQAEIEAALYIARQSLMELTGTPITGLATLSENTQFAPLTGDIKQLVKQTQSTIPLIHAQNKEIEKEVGGAFLSTNASLRRIKSATRSLNVAIEARQEMLRGFGYGLQSVYHVLLSEERIFSAKKDLLGAKYAYIKNFIRFKLASGTLSLQSLKEINNWLKS